MIQIKMENKLIMDHLMKVLLEVTLILKKITQTQVISELKTQK